MWKPWLPGARPATLASTTTLSPFCVNVTVPLAVLPFVGSSFAVAFGPVGAIDAHPAASMAAAIKLMPNFMRPPEELAPRARSAGPRVPRQVSAPS